MARQDNGQPPQDAPGHPKEIDQRTDRKASPGKRYATDDSQGQAEGNDPSLAHGKTLRREVGKP